LRKVSHPKGLGENQSNLRNSDKHDWIKSSRKHEAFLEIGGFMAVIFLLKPTNLNEAHEASFRNTGEE